MSQAATELGRVEGLLAAEEQALEAERKRGRRTAAHLLGAVRRQTERLLVDLRSFLLRLEADLPVQVESVDDLDAVKRTVPHWLHHVVEQWMASRLATWRVDVLTDLAELRLDDDDLDRAELLVPALHPSPVKSEGGWGKRIGITAAVGSGAALLVFGLWLPGLLALTGGIAWSALGRAAAEASTRRGLIDAATDAVRGMGHDADRLLAGPDRDARAGAREARRRAGRRARQEPVDPARRARAGADREEAAPRRPGGDPRPARPADRRGRRERSRSRGRRRLTQALDEFARRRTRGAELLEGLADTVDGTGIVGVGPAAPAAYLRSTAERVREGRFVVLLLGCFSSGKSTLLNALLGQPVLPVKVNPCTAILTEVVYAESPSVESVRPVAPGEPGRVEPMTPSAFVDLFQLRTSSETEAGAEATDRFGDVDRAVVGWPLPAAAERGGAARQPRASTTTRCAPRARSRRLPDADAVIVVLSANRFLTDLERRTLRRELLPLGLRNLFFPVTMVDLLSSLADDPGPAMTDLAPGRGSSSARCARWAARTGSRSGSSRSTPGRGSTPAGTAPSGAAGTRPTRTCSAPPASTPFEERPRDRSSSTSAAARSSRTST